MASNIQLDDPTSHVIGLINRLYLWPGKFLAGRATWCRGFGRNGAENRGRCHIR
ncbi:hypothetical protein FRAHR75_1310001 [Frankia sp. Hr75.2]|nr:hypothetical protein FRAHR75_1310001 [Frankia sp. Hr75.2]